MKHPLALLALSTLLLAACKGTGNTDTIKLGLLQPLTGDAAAIGQDILHGAEWAVEEMNAKGGVNGKMVKLFAEDGKCTGSEAANGAQKLVNVDRVVAIVGGGCSGETLAAAPIIETAKVVLLSPASSSPDVTNAGDFVFRNYPSDALKTDAMAKYFKEKGYKNIVIISENTDFSQAFRTSLKEKLPTSAVAFDEIVEPGTKDFRSLITRLKNLKFDVFFANPNSDAVVAVMIQQFREAGFAQEAISHDVAESLTVPEIAGKAAEGFKFINVPTAGEGSDFEGTAKERFGAPQASITWVSYGYDATNILLQAMANVGTDGTAIRDYLYKLPEYKGIVGTIHFDKNGDVVGIPYALKTFQDGKIVKVKDIPLE